MNIYDNQDHAKSGFTGCAWLDFSHLGFYFWINKGSTADSVNRVRAYSISVQKDNANIFYLSAFEGGTLFTFLSSLPGSASNPLYETIANMVFATAMEKTNIVSLLDGAFARVHDQAFREGKTDVQLSIKEALGL